VTSPVTARIPNEQIATLRRLARLLGTTPSCMVAVCVARTLDELSGRPSAGD
jgi:hypothetical protein